MSGASVEVAIVGGGLHGVHLAARLVLEGRLRPEELVVVDPGPRLLDRWRARSRTVGMSHLRSPEVHHLGLAPFELRDEPSGSRRLGAFMYPYGRPSLELFDAHCDRVILRAELAERHLSALVSAVVLPPAGRVRLETTAGVIEAGRLVLALGRAARDPPTWAERLEVPTAAALADGFDLASWPRGPRGHVVGGGLSAAQLALRLVREHVVEHVTLHARHPPREHMFDADPGWLGPKHLAAFDADPSPAGRRRRIRDARHTGSLTPEVLKQLRHAQRAGCLEWREGEVDPARLDAPTLFAMGLDSARPGGALVDGLAERPGFPVAPCGYPVPGRALTWGDERVVVTGPLAELELGPTAGNISGARRAAERIAHAFPTRARRSA